MRGLDYDEAATGQSEDEIVEALARKLGCIVVASGAVDIISNGEKTIRIESGSQMQKRITGAGCMLSAVICTKLCNGPVSSQSLPLAWTVAYCCKTMGDAAAKAAETTDKPMSFLNCWIDEVSMAL